MAVQYVAKGPEADICIGLGAAFQLQFDGTLKMRTAYPLISTKSSGHHSPSKYAFRGP
jgi:hypothetical protein